MFDTEDHESFERAANIINELIDRHGHDLTMQALTEFCSALRSLRLAEKYLEATHD